MTITTSTTEGTTSLLLLLLDLLNNDLLVNKLQGRPVFSDLINASSHFKINYTYNNFSTALFIKKFFR